MRIVRLLLSLCVALVLEYLLTCSTTSAQPCPGPDAGRVPSCSCPDQCRTPLPGEDASDEDLLVLDADTRKLQPAVARRVLRVLQDDRLLASMNREKVAEYLGHIYVLRKIAPERRTPRATPPDAPDTAFSRWSDLVATVRKMGGDSEANHRYRLQSDPDDPELKKQWPLSGMWNGSENAKSCPGVSPFCTPSCSGAAAVGASGAWAFADSKPNVAEKLIMIVDDIPHDWDDLGANLWTNPVEKGGDEDSTGVTKDIHGYSALTNKGINAFALSQKQVVDHGTSVMSIIAAVGNNDHRLASLLLERAKIVLCQPDVTVASYIACLDYATRLHDAASDESGIPKLLAVNVSGGGTRCSCALERQIHRLRERGVLVVAAAGNDGCENGPRDANTQGCTTWSKGGGKTCGECAFYPASHPVSNVIAVGASSCSGAPAFCSNYGARSVHLFAPGVDILTLGDEHFQRTSAAAPHVTGVLGLLYRVTGDDWRSLRSRILAGGVPSGKLLNAVGDAVKKRESITGRNLRAWNPSVGDLAGTGALSCIGQRVRRRVLPREDRLEISSTGTGVNGSLRIVALALECEKSDGTVPLAVAPLNSDGTPGATVETKALLDGGVDGDECVGDGEHALVWARNVPGTYKLALWPGTVDEDSLIVDVK